MLMDSFGYAHRYELCYPHEVLKVVKENGIVFFPFGAVEEHGTHQDMTADYFTCHCIGLATAELTGGLVYPSIPIAPPGAPPLNREQMRTSKDLATPSVFISVECCRKLYLEFLESFAQIGFKLFVGIGAHGPGQTLFNNIVKDIGGKMGTMDVMPFHVMDGIGDMRKEFPQSWGHGRTLETAIAWYCGHKGTCKLKQIHGNHQYYHSQVSSSTSEQLDEFSEQTTLELGKKYFDAHVTRLASLINEWKIQSNAQV